MGYLMKEVLQTLCGVNQWSYAVFWKIGCQNPKLLIREECYYGSASCSLNGNLEFAFQDYNSSVSAEMVNLQSAVQAGDKVHLLVSKMMMENHFSIVGEGLVGRVAFTGNHQWILSENYYKESHPPEVLKEVYQQFSAGVQTVAVIPVLPHGVVQLGSTLTIAENMGFVNDVVSLVLQLAYVPGFLQSDNYAAKELAPKIEGPVCPLYSTPVELPLESDMINTGEVQNEMQSTIVAFQDSNSSPYHLKPQDWHDEAKAARAVKLDCSSANQFTNGVAKAEVIPSNSDIWMSGYSSLHNSASVKDLSSSSLSTLNHGSVRCTEQNILSDFSSQGNFTNPLSSNMRTNSGFISSSYEGSCRPSVEANELCQGASSNVKPMTSIDSLADGSKKPTFRGVANLNLSKMESTFSDSVNCLTTNSLLSYSSGSKSYHMNNKFTRSELNPSMEEIEQNTVPVQTVPLTQHDELLKVEDDRKPKIEGQSHPVNNSNYDDASVQPQCGDDLFDILGADFKNKLFSSYWSSCLSNGHNWEKNDSPSRKNLASSEIYSTSPGNSDSGIFSLSGTDSLLDAMVSNVYPPYNQSLDNNVSCRTTLTDRSSSCAPKFSRPSGHVDDVKGELLGIPKYLAKAGAVSSSSLRTVSTVEDSGTYSQSSCIYDSWIGNMKQNNSVATGYCNKLNEKSKTNRKRLKPCENPRPRPKDRQMIQDRVKELREIVPNGAKCSIDALLERTIKHMLFLQTVTKHAAKLKQTAESKIINNDGGLLMKDNLGGATWAYEIGSQSLVCPIKVEDLNQPRQMLVEMLCEERGSFLEIADVIRGLGLTILKGLMETRNDKIWARFAVEANRDVTRMEIFLSLVRLLEQNAKDTIPHPNNSSNKNTLIQEFHQATSVPAIGRSCS
ncbi:hypothetical protein CDL12_23589 [Handroanthus impetiginosus]|uniref:BHLH domain-containing protein n=1 Tax=Handroanthus impetiginosus TaxID=429701 RepID=A0A2G9GF14_9LAMI|nr:hypothetical protein CDL12_23589 [Handroanthus impetiginosus]